MAARLDGASQVDFGTVAAGVVIVLIPVYLFFLSFSNRSSRAFTPARSKVEAAGCIHSALQERQL